MRNILLTTLLLCVASASLAATTPTAAPVKKTSVAKQVVKPHTVATKKASTHTTNKPTTTTEHHTTTHHTSHHTTYSSGHTSHTQHHHSTPQVKPVALADDVNDRDVSASSNTTSFSSWTSSAEKKLASFAHQTVDTLHYSSYKYGGRRFDPEKGIYQVDCSRYVDNLLNQANPSAFYTLARWSGSESPTSEHYYQFFNRLSNGSGNQWRKVENGQNLQAGDILVFRYLSSHGRAAGGHVMVVMDKSKVRDDVVAVRVADSAAAGHSEDTRGFRKSGVGIGTLLLKINPHSGQPYAFAWRTDAPWRQNVNIAMGRPADKVTA